MWYNGKVVLESLWGKLIAGVDERLCFDAEQHVGVSKPGPVICGLLQLRLFDALE
jgi:hypothetical protein